MPRSKPGPPVKPISTPIIDALEHEAQIFAAIGVVLHKEGMEDGDDKEYANFAKMLTEGGINLAKASQGKESGRRPAKRPA